MGHVGWQNKSPYSKHTIINYVKLIGVKVNHSPEVTLLTAGCILCTAFVWNRTKTYFLNIPYLWLAIPGN